MSRVQREDIDQIYSAYNMAANRVENPAFDLDDIHESLVGIAYKAGKIITSALPATNDTGSKKNSQSFLQLRSRICIFPKKRRMDRELLAN